MTSNILILGDKEIHTETIGTKLQKQGCQVIHFSPNDNPEISLSFQGSEFHCEISHTMDHQTDYYNFQEFDRVWNRMKFGTMIEWKHPMEKLASDFSKASWKQVMSSLENIFPHHQDGNGPQWIDAFGTLNLNGNKPFQLKLAHECGLKIPEWTCITNRKESLKSFEMPSFHSSSPRYGMIMKTLSLCVAPPCNSMFTIPISYNQLS